MEIKGNVVQILEQRTGMGKKGQWKTQDFILDTGGQYNKKVCLSVWGDSPKVPQVGESITAFIDLESREYNGRWYTDVKAWKIHPGSLVQHDPGTSTPGDASNGNDDLPF